MPNLQKATANGSQICWLDWLWDGFVAKALDFAWCCLVMRHQINSARCHLLHPLSFLIPLKFQQVEREQNRKFMRYTHWVAMSLKDLQRNIIHKSWGARRACHLEMSTCHRSWRRRKQLRIYQWLQGFRSIDSSQSYEISDLQKTLIKHIMSHSSEEPGGCCWKTFLVITRYDSLNNLLKFTTALLKWKIFVMKLCWWCFEYIDLLIESINTIQSCWQEDVCSFFPKTNLFNFISNVENQFAYMASEAWERAF